MFSCKVVLYETELLISKLPEAVLLEELPLCILYKISYKPILINFYLTNV